MTEKNKGIILCELLGCLSVIVGMGLMFGLGAALVACGALFLFVSVLAI